MSQRNPHHGTSSSIDFNSTKPASRPRLERPNSSPSTATTSSAIATKINKSNIINTPATQSPSSSSTASTSTSTTSTATGAATGRSGQGSGSGTTGRASRPPNAVQPGKQRPKTAYQAVTWKENLDAFNRRLRRGSLSLDAAAQEEEMASQAIAQARAQAKAQQKKQARESYYPHHHHPQDQHDDHADPTLRKDPKGLGATVPEEQTQLLGKGTKKTNGITNTSQGYGAAATGAQGQMHDSLSSLYLRGQAAIARLFNSSPCQAHPPDEESHDHAFPTQLNPVVATKKSSKLGVFSGVFVPCVLSIWGIILFLRFGFIIGQAGVLGTMAMFIVGYTINIFTTMSLSAISTNGTVRGGGVYYLLSRSLGPEFGGSIGLIYFLGTVIGCGMNVLGFVEPLISNFGESSGTVYRVLPESKLWDFIYGTILLVSCTLVCLVGSKLFSRASLVLAVIILLSTLSIFISFAMVPPFTHPERNIEYTGFSWETLQENLWPRFTVMTGPDGTKESFQSVFGVLFPACIGILAGASMSGDLENPSKSIPTGTLWAVGSTFCVYTFIVVLMGGSISRSTMYTDLSVLQDISISPLMIAAGALAASVFATLGSVIGAAKLLQAIARDNLLPFLSVFGQGTPKTDEPTIAVLLTFILCQFCLFLTDMNAIAMFVSMVTLLTFLIINLACFLLKIGSAPNFRPSFRFFHWWTAFGGMVSCALVMGLVDLGKSLLSGLIVSVIFIWIHYWSPPKRWGDVTQSLIYHQVRKYLLRLDSRKEHVKFWRPQILLLVHHPRSEYHLIQFCNHLKKGALYVLGHVILGDLRDVLPEYRRQQGSWLKFVDVLQIKAFVNLAVADSVRIGARNLLIGTGLGGMRPNIVVLGSFNLQRLLKLKEEEQRHSRALRQQQQQRDDEEGGPLPIAIGSPVHHHSPVTPQVKGGNTFNSIAGPTHITTSASGMADTLLNVPISLPIDNIRVEAPIKITDYVSIIEDVLSLNKAVAIAYGFDKLDLPEEQSRSIWNLLSLAANSENQRPPPSTSASRASSMHRHGDKKKKKYIDLWPMQMSVAPLPCYEQPLRSASTEPGMGTQKRMSRDMGGGAHGSPRIPSEGGHGTMSYSEGSNPGYPSHSHPHPRAEANLTNFDTYTMVLQMGCILHMVPHWKENFLLRVMVFVEYKEDVEEEKKRLKALLENLRIPAEVKVMCLDGGDSETYDRLVKGEGLEEYVNDTTTEEDVDEEEWYDSDEREEQNNETHAVEISGRSGLKNQQQQPTTTPGPQNINPLWQQSHPPLAEEDENEESRVIISTSPAATTGIQEDGRDSSHETGPYSSVASHGPVSRSRTTSSSDSRHQEPPHQQHQPVFEASAPPPQRRRTISHPDGPKRNQSLSPNGLTRGNSIMAGKHPLRSNTAISPWLHQGGFPIGISSSSVHPMATGSGAGAGVRYRSSMMIGSGSPSSDAAAISRLGTSAPLGASMNFRIAVPLPRQYFDPNGMNSESDSDSISSEDDEAYDHNDDDLVYGSGGNVAGSMPSGGMYQQPPQHSQSLQRLGSQQSRLFPPSGLRQPVAHRPFGKWQATLPSVPQHRRPSSQQQQQQQQQQQIPSPQATSLFAHTSLGSEPGLGIAMDPQESFADTERETLGGINGKQSLGGATSSIAKNPWASDDSSASHSTDTFQSLITSSLAPPIAATTASQLQDQNDNASAAPLAEENIAGHDIPHSIFPPGDPNMHMPEIEQQYASATTQSHTLLHQPSTLTEISAGPSLPVQFDHLGPEAQLLILNELMRIHSSSETTSIIFTTVPAPEEGTCLSEQSSIAYVDQLDSLMEGIDVPVLLIHAKSLTVTMTL
ncbi:solute carrier family 12 (potassium/chloride transporters), member 9 [Entomortierella parvispora]|uniref:Solute carrier family 12 (Potassium/chloride transporters), member 9 n=1 Tax=Entomortierella parvispora TaxID=205924 RepID=A0A9P3LTU9_9FUNG|nr:solute carrier family 12 (potassium/chloride transporters), member 9 [Entomortierella parvispora]